MNLRSFRNLNLKNKKVLVRVDFNSPLKNKRILDDSRIKAHLPTILSLIKKRAKIILISHLDNPQKIKSCRLRIKKYSLRPVAKYFNNLRIANKKNKLRIKFVDDCLGEKVRRAIQKLKAGEIILLENLRFYSTEEKNDKNFAKKLSSLVDFYINDAFSVSHRPHASVSAITKYLPSYAGLLLEKEIKNLSKVLEKEKHPLIMIMGGAKVATKLQMIENLINQADKILIGGVLANTFFKAQGLKISDSLYEPIMVNKARKLLKNKKIVLPVDIKVKLKTKNKKLKMTTKNLKIEELNRFKKFMILDVGLETTELFAKFIKDAKMIVWNGPLGFIEEKLFEQGTGKIIEEIFRNKKTKIVIGGGDTLAALRQVQIRTEQRRNIFLSMGGGAMLEFLSGKKLPGLEPLFI